MNSKVGGKAARVKVTVVPTEGVTEAWKFRAYLFDRLVWSPRRFYRVEKSNRRTLL
jgi:hypothetical protein